MTGALTGAEALRRVVEGYGRNAVADPGALRLALREVAADADPEVVEQLVAVAGSGAVEVLRAAGRRGTARDAAVVEALQAAPAGTTAITVLAFAEALDAHTPPTDAGTVTGGPARAVARIRWDDEADEPGELRPPPARRRRTVVAVVTGAAVVAVAALVAVLLTTARTAPPPPDRSAVDQVAQRYRALGATLLDGALGCAPASPEPGQTERVACSFGTWSITLTTYDSTSRLAAVRAARTTPDRTAVREAVSRGDGSAAVLRETADPGDPTVASAAATLYWDADVPRPVSAEVTTTAVSMPELARFWDARAVPGIARPDLPGPEFDSAALWKTAREFIELSGATCGAVPADESYPGAVEEHRCSYPNGHTAEFVLLGSEEELYDHRTIYADPYGVRPGTQRLGNWTTSDGVERGQVIEYVYDRDGVAYLYFDEPATRSFGLMSGPGPDQQRLKTFWVDVSAG